MSSFTTPHFFFLFAMKTGKKKLAYGQNPEDAYENLKLRLTPDEMAPIIKEEFLKIPQRELRNHINELG
ncbi:hypothetical protein [Pedosphaera parvula]|uniref:Uncharacterized protein n=1 Tax=Pedosphaera parvula (strain Ellin514) TaxID=320771 RepID=B9XRK8_PEDPL|nr:hypothetical protein [Pedosphaera parvula]EEF57527.1 hypothetical protein Cflav_PD0536 [Pedosphaera parvula Ellin514]